MATTIPLKRHFFPEKHPEMLDDLQGKISKQAFSENNNPKKIGSQDDVAERLSANKFGVSDKTEILVLNNSNE